MAIIDAERTNMTDMKAARPEGIPVAIHESEMEIMGVKVRVHVLDDGRRVINAEDFAAVIAAMSGET
jgi:hypothetical protein